MARIVPSSLFVPHLPRGLAQADSLSGGTVTECLREWSAARVSNPAIARLLASRFGLQVSSETVRRWLRSLDEPNGDEEAA